MNIHELGLCACESQGSLAFPSLRMNRDFNA